MSNYSCTNNHCGPCMPQPCPPPCPQPVPCKTCPCGEELRQVLNLLCCQNLSAAVNFNAFVFFSDYYVLGSTLSGPAGNTGPSDNIAKPAASYLCGGDGCETITVSGSLYAPVPNAEALPSVVTQAALCSLKAISFDAAGGDPNNFQLISQTLTQMLRPCHTPPCCPCLATALTSAASSRTATIAAGSLVVENGTILGQLGNVLVLSNSTDNRFYLICANAIDFIG